jgi:hypothetical protein
LAIGLIEDKIISKFTQKGGIGIFKSYQFITDSNGNQIKCSEYCGNHDKLLSMDTDKFILPNGTYSYSNLDTDRGPVHIEIPVVSDPEVDKTKTFNANNGENGYIRNILVHKQVIKDALASCTSIMDLMERILSEINKYSLNYFNFKIIADSTTQTSKIIDFDGGSNSVRSLLESQSTLEFKIMERGSIVRNISMGSKLPNKMKTAAMYSINGLSPDTNGSALGRMFNGVSDSYLNYLKSKHATENEQFKPAPSTKIIDTDFIDRALAARDKILNAKNPIVEWHINEKY